MKENQFCFRDDETIGLTFSECALFSTLLENNDYQNLDHAIDFVEKTDAKDLQIMCNGFVTLSIFFKDAFLQSLKSLRRKEGLAALDDLLYDHYSVLARKYEGTRNRDD